MIQFCFCLIRKFFALILYKNDIQFKNAKEKKAVLKGALILYKNDIQLTRESLEALKNGQALILYKNDIQLC